ncbi:MAG: glycine cleavage T C-terminal barrel domain-containing protein, partial [Acidimicrobiales bacterium]
DTLRLEAGLPLHGHELGPGITPLQAGLAWVVGWDKGDFPGRTALETERRDGPSRVLRGLRAEGRQPPREGAEVRAGGRRIGVVTSGNFSPMLERGIALAYLDVSAALADGDRATVSVRGRDLGVTVVPVRFWPPRAAAGTGAKTGSGTGGAARRAGGEAGGG